MSPLIPPLPQPEEFSQNTACPWCGSDADEWDPELGTDHDAPCCGKPIRWDYEKILSMPKEQKRIKGTLKNIVD